MSIDGGPVQVVNMNKNKSKKAWEEAVSNNIKVKTTVFQVGRSGWHALKFHLISPGVILQKIVIDMGGRKKKLFRTSGELSLE